MLIKKSIRTDILIVLLSLILISIIIIFYVCTNLIMIIGENVQQITTQALQSQAENFLVQLTTTTAEKNDIILKKISIDASNVAEYTKNIFENPKAFARDYYWKFDDHIFMGAGGQHLNGKDDVSSVFIPNYINISDVKEEMELNAYLDLVFPKVLENNPDAVAIWAVGLQGEARYYPNIGLGNVVPPDNNPTKEVFFTPATPENNPERKVTWSVLYDDPAGQGLMITTVAPIYTKQKGFVGVIGIDVSLNEIIKSIEEYNSIEDSYFFLIDKEGYSIALPEEAYKIIFDKNKETNESRVNLNNLTNEFGSVINKMKEGSNGFQSINIGDKELYVAYAPLKNIGFSLGVIVEKAVILKSIANIQKEVKESTYNMTYLRILPITLLVLFTAFILGFFWIRKIIQPIKRLTKVVEEISKGDLNQKIQIKSKDEIGELALAFNKMVSDLKESKKKIDDYSKDLEKQVSERTNELNSKVEELESTKTAILNILEDTDDANKKLLELQENLKANIKELKKLDEKKDQFISIAAHELKTPLTSIQGFSDLLSKSNIAENTDLRTKYLGIIHKDAKRLGELISNILDLSRIDIGALKVAYQDVKISDLIDEIREQMDIIIREKGLKSEFKFENNLPIINLDKGKVIQVISNLINNAIHYTEKGKISVEIKKEDSNLLFSVSDTGVGIPKESQDRIFERFYQVDIPLTRKIGGTGLGLSICKAFVETMGGKIWFESKIGEGTTFYFTLPIKKDDQKKEIELFNDKTDKRRE